MIKNKRKIFIIFTILALFLVGIVSMENSHSAPNAFGNACSEMGSYMGRTEVNTRVVNPDKPNRKWTVEELFRDATKFTSYYGEGEGSWIYANKVDRGKARVSKTIGKNAWNDSGVQNKLKSARGVLGCITGRGDIIPNMFLSITGGVVTLISSMVSLLIGNDTMVEGLVNIIGGGGDATGGLIGTFTNSIYMPLVVIAFFLTTVTIVYKGLIQMRLREALSSIIWSVLAFVIGLALMLNPAFLASAPQKVTSTITTCVLGALSGQNCLTEEVTTPSLLAGHECRSEIVGGENGVDMMVNSMSCTIWKTFVLEIWAQKQFGEPYSQLYTDNIPEGGSEWKNLPEGKGKQYCVNLTSTKSANDVSGEVDMDAPQTLDSNSTVCNVALYQLYLKTKINDPVNHQNDGYSPTKPEGGKAYDARWYDIIVPMANDSSNWDNWMGKGQLLGRILTSWFASIAVILAAVVLITFSMFGAAYKIISVIMMAFAPVFLLFAIEPNRGRRIFLGWLETLFSSILKYFAITMLLVVSLVLYAGVLSNTSGPTAFISVIVLTATLWMYRKEIVDLIGASNLGGQRLSNKAKEKMEGARKQIKEKGSAIVGGAIGGAVGNLATRNANVANRNKRIEYLRNQINDSTSPEEKERINSLIEEEEEAKAKEGTVIEALRAGSKEGAKESFKRAIKRGTSAPAMMMRQYDNTKRKMEKSDKIKDYERELEKFRKEQSEKNVGNANNTETPAPPTEEDLKRMKSIDKQRDTVVYDESLSSEEKEALGEFVDKLNEIINDDDLLNLADSDEVRNDNNKRDLVNNEINARLKYNTLNNIPSGKLSRHNLAKLDYVSDEELKINLDIYKENYLETGNEEDYDRFKDIVNERVKRGTINETVGNMLIKKTEEARVDLEKSGEKYTRKSNIPTLEEFDKNPEKYINKEEMTVSENLKKAEKLREETEKTGGTYVFKDSQGNYVSNSPIVVLMSDEKRKERTEKSKGEVVAGLDIDSTKYDIIDEFMDILGNDWARKYDIIDEFMDILGNDWARQQSANILGDLARNPGAGGVGAMGAGMGMGMAAGNVFGNMANQMFAPMGGQSQQQQPVQPQPPQSNYNNETKDSLNLDELTTTTKQEKKDSEPRQKNKSDNSRNENSRNQNNETILPDLDEFDIPKETPNDVEEVDLESNQANQDDNSDNDLNLPPLD